MSEKESKPLSAGEIAGISIGACIGCLLLCGLFIWYISYVIRSYPGALKNPHFGSKME